MRIILVVFICLSCSVFGQKAKIVGKVIDEDKNPIFGATVLYRKDVSLGAYSDVNGNYLLEVPEGEALIIFRYSGMLNDTIRINPKADETITMNVVLKPYVQLIDGVEIKVGKFDRPLEDQTVSLEIIRPDFIENRNTRSIEKALDQTPGLNILDGEPQIRGGSGFTFGVGSKVAVIVDDMPMLSGDAGRPEWGFIPVENIHQIEVTKGAASVLSGSSALSGAIHIRTAFPKLKPLTKVNVYSGIYSEPNVEGGTWWKGTPLIAGANVLHSRQFGNLDFVIGANVNYDHGYLGPPITDSLVTPDTLSNFSEAQMASKRARVNFNLRYRSKKYKGLNYGINGNVMLSQSNLTFAWLNDSSGLFRAYPGAVFLQDQFIFNLDPFINFYTATEGKHSLRMRILHADNQMTANQSNVATSYYADYMFQKTLPRLQDVDLVGGITGSYVDSRSNMYIGSGSPNNHLVNVSAYSQIEKKVYKALNLSVGGRIEYFSLNDSIRAIKPIFRAGASLKVLQETYVRASYGQGYRFPTITERFIRTGVGNFGVFPNSDLKPESSWNGEVGVKQGLKFGKLYGYLDIAGFWQEYQNTIEYLFGFWGDPSGGLGEVFGFRFVNTGRTRVLGIDASFSGKAKIGKNAELNFMTGYNYILPQTLNPDYVYAIDKINREYSYNKTSLDSTRGILKYRFLHNIKADFELVIRKKFAIGISAKYFSKIINMDGVIEEFENATQGPFVQTIRYMDYFRNHQHGNWIFDARVSYAISDRHKIALISANVMNRVYSLRPLKIEQPRTIMLQYSFKIDEN